jgi:hypothetical protein
MQPSSHPKPAGHARHNPAGAPRGKVSARQERAILPRRSAADRELAHRMLAALKAGDDIRQRKVRRLKAAIKVRAYENDLKLEVAVDRLQGIVAEGTKARRHEGTKGRICGR